MSRSVFRPAPHAAMMLALALAAGCAERPTAEHYAAFEAELRTTGKLRTETAPEGASYDAADLVRNFRRIALHHEADVSRPGGEKNWNQNPVMRWEGPLNYSLFGDAVTQEDRREVTDLMQRVAALTGLEVTETGDEVNFFILITTPDERRDFSDDLAKLSPALARTFDLWRSSPRVICLANNLFSTEDGNVIGAGMVVIGSETSGILRQACLHEEIIQALGLANDHPGVRPSIFNDDGEFALLTEHDEHLLRILYDPRLATGMTAEQAMPIVRQIAAEIPLGQQAGKLAGAATVLAQSSDAAAAELLAAQGVPKN